MIVGGRVVDVSVERLDDASAEDQEENKIVVPNEELADFFKSLCVTFDEGDVTLVVQRRRDAVDSELVDPRTADEDAGLPDEEEDYVDRGGAPNLNQVLVFGIEGEEEGEG